MYDQPFGPHHFGPAPLWLAALMTGFSLLLWIGLPVLLLWAGMRLSAQRPPAPTASQLAEPLAPSAAEILRRRYVLGQIDAMTFERMLERVLFAEAYEASGQRLAPRRVRVWESEGDPSSPATALHPTDDAELL